MEDIFREKAAADFVKFAQSFANSIVNLHPACDKASRLKAHLDSARGGDEQALIEQWLRLTDTPLAKREVKYAKAIERITGKSGTVYHACEYNDVDVFAAALRDDEVFDIDFADKYAAMAEEDRRVVWKYVCELNSCALKAIGRGAPQVPTREEIRQSIKSKKVPAADTGQGQGVSMATAFAASLRNLCASLGAPAIDLRDGDELNAFMSRWATMGQGTVHGQKLAALCSAKNILAISQIAKAIPELNVGEAEITDEVWTHINEMNGYSAVGQNIPSNMMNKIETMAQRLAEDITSGKRDLASMDLSAIGQQVISQCDEGDMHDFASNIEHLLPAIQSFQQQMQQH